MQELLFQFSSFMCSIYYPLRRHGLISLSLTRLERDGRASVEQSLRKKYQPIEWWLMRIIVTVMLMMIMNMIVQIFNIINVNDLSLMTNAIVM